jgi:LAO/AO transport system kinase
MAGKPPKTAQALVQGVRAGDRAALGRAITLVESSRAADRSEADALIDELMPHAGGALRVGISGSPGVGKSTLIEELGTRLTGQGHRVAVLAVDPSSSRTGGSILGDKTRMGKLARDPSAFIRPTPSSGALGGVARRTRETIVVCEAAGFDIVIVETVGVGQSEVMVAQMVDVFVVLVLAGGGDELQGIKRGILELADLVAVTKADGDNVERAERTRHQYKRALDLIPPRDPAWTPRVLTCSAITGDGIDALWSAVADHRDALQTSGSWDRQRQDQRVRWMWQALETALSDALHADPEVAKRLRDLENQVRAGSLAPDRAAAQLLRAFLQRA